MYKELIVNVTEHETRVALLEDGVLAELFIERGDDANITGNIYKGRVQRVLPGMQAAFVDIGLNQAAFIHADDLMGEGFDEIERRLSESVPAERVDREAAEEAPVKESPRIEQMVNEGQEIMVQVAKAPISTKGARVTSHVSLPGRLLVLMPTVNHIGISKRIGDEKERCRLKELILALRSENFGFILRTAAKGASEEQLSREIDYLVGTWRKIRKKSRAAQVPSLLNSDLTVTLRAVRDLLSDSADKLVIDSREGYQAVAAFLKAHMNGGKVTLELHRGPEPLFDQYNLERQIARALKKKVWLKSGGYLVIEHTEALAAIDINTGRYVGKSSFEETILRTNLEAAKEIAYQIRLRNIGGIIIIDFIDMDNLKNQERVYNALLSALKGDKSKTNVLPITELGLVQMTRKRVRKALTRMLCKPCFYCHGNGHLLSWRTICYNIYREVLREAEDMMGIRFILKVHPDVAELLGGEEKKMVDSLARNIGKEIVIEPVPRFHIEEFEIIESLKES